MTNILQMCDMHYLNSQSGVSRNHFIYNLEPTRHSKIVGKSISYQRFLQMFRTRKFSSFLRGNRPIVFMDNLVIFKPFKRKKTRVFSPLYAKRRQLSFFSSYIGQNWVDHSSVLDLKSVSRPLQVTDTGLGGSYATEQFQQDLAQKVAGTSFTDLIHSFLIHNSLYGTIYLTNAHKLARDNALGSPWDCDGGCRNGISSKEGKLVKTRGSHVPCNYEKTGSIAGSEEGKLGDNSSSEKDSALAVNTVQPLWLHSVQSDSTLQVQSLRAPRDTPKSPSSHCKSVRSMATTSLHETSSTSFQELLRSVLEKGTVASPMMNNCLYRTNLGQAIQQIDSNNNLATIPDLDVQTDIGHTIHDIHSSTSLPSILDPDVQIDSSHTIHDIHSSTRLPSIPGPYVQTDTGHTIHDMHSSTSLPRIPDLDVEIDTGYTIHDIHSSTRLPRVPNPDVQIDSGQTIHDIQSSTSLPSIPGLDVQTDTGHTIHDMHSSTGLPRTHDLDVQIDTGYTIHDMHSSTSLPSIPGSDVQTGSGYTSFDVHSRSTLPSIPCPDVQTNAAESIHQTHDRNIVRLCSLDVRTDLGETINQIHSGNVLHYDRTVSSQAIYQNHSSAISPSIGHLDIQRDSDQAIYQTQSSTILPCIPYTGAHQIHSLNSWLSIPDVRMDCGQAIHQTQFSSISPSIPDLQLVLNSDGQPTPTPEVDLTNVSKCSTISTVEVVRKSGRGCPKGGWPSMLNCGRIRKRLGCPKGGWPKKVNDKEAKHVSGNIVGHDRTHVDKRAILVEADFEVLQPTTVQLSKKEDCEYQQKLEIMLDKPFRLEELQDLEEHACRRKPLLRLRETRQRVLHVATKRDGMSYLDYHPDLARKLADVEAPEDKLKLLRGFFFWLQHSCMSGAFKPWAPHDEKGDESDDCVEIFPEGSVRGNAQAKSYDDKVERVEGFQLMLTNSGDKSKRHMILRPRKRKRSSKVKVANHTVKEKVKREKKI